MPRSPATLTADLLARVRPGAAVAVAVGASSGILARRPRGYRAQSGARVAPAGQRGSLPPAIGAVAVVEIRGVMEQRESAWSCGETCGYDGIERDIIAALADPGVSALVIDADTPGGDEPGLVETAERIRAAALDSGKPVIGYSPALLASAGVWLLLSICDLVIVHRTARVGSIGAVAVFASDARKLADEGTDVYVARSPAGKMNPNPVEALDDLGRSRLDEHALTCSEDFIATVARLRGLDPQVIRGWDGALFRGQAAVDAGLVDGLGTLEDVIQLAAARAELQEAA